MYAKIAEYLAARGHDVQVVHTDFSLESWWRGAEGSRRSQLSIEALPAIPTPSSLPWLRGALPPNPRALGDLRRMLGLRWDVAHVHGVGFPLIDYAAHVLHGLGIPYVFTVHGVPRSPLSRGRIAAAALRWYLAAWTSKTAARAATVTAVSAALRSDPVFAVPTAEVIYNGIEPTALRPREERDGPVRIVSLSRLSGNKGLDVALEAVAALRAGGMDVSYDLWGSDGGERAELVRMRDRLGLGGIARFCGVFRASSRNEILGTADVVLVPSRVEAFGLVALEALAAGVPLVASRVEGLAEILNDDVAVLVPPGDAAALAQGIVAALQRRQELVRLGVEHARTFEWNAILPKYERRLIAVARVRA